MITLATMTALSFFLRSGDRVVFYGDSITEQRLYTTYVEAFTLTRYPKLDVRFYGRGWGGDSSWGGGGGSAEERVKLDVNPLKPSAIVVMLGMNDSGYVPYDPKIEKVIKEAYPKLIGFLADGNPGARLTLARTCPWDDYAHTYAHDGKPPEPWAPWHGYNEVIRRYSKIVQDEAAHRSATYVDFNEPLSEVLTAATQENHAVATQIIPDSIHPGPAGHLVMASELLKTWGVDPKVSRVELDASNSKVLAADGAKVSHFSGLSWEQIDERLPFAMEPDSAEVQLVKRLYKFDQQLNRQELVVRGLAEGTYQLSIDGKKVAEFASADLLAGVNLASFETPMREQALDVFRLCQRRSDLDFVAWRQVQREEPTDKLSDRAFQALEALADDVHERARKRAIPMSHRFRIEKVR